MEHCLANVITIEGELCITPPWMQNSTVHTAYENLKGARLLLFLLVNYTNMKVIKFPKQHMPDCSTYI